MSYSEKIFNFDSGYEQNFSPPYSLDTQADLSGSHKKPALTHQYLLECGADGLHVFRPKSADKLDQTGLVNCPDLITYGDNLPVQTSNDNSNRRVSLLCGRGQRNDDNGSSCDINRRSSDDNAWPALSDFRLYLAGDFIKFLLSSGNSGRYKHSRQQGTGDNDL